MTGGLVMMGLLAAWIAGQPEATRTVVFVCEHGSAKSVVAAAHFNRLASELGLDVRAVSRGTVPDAVMAPAAVAGLQQDGLSPGATAPVRLTVADLEAAERVVTFCDLPAELSAGRVPNREVKTWEVPPVSTHYEASRDAMLPRIEALLRSLQGRVPANEGERSRTPRLDAARLRARRTCHGRRFRARWLHARGSSAGFVAGRGAGWPG